MVSIIVGSKSDLETIEETKRVLDDFGVRYELKVLSAHRTPEALREYIKEIEGREIQVIIAGAGMSAHLPGVIASLTLIPVIGVPMKDELLGIPALFSISQMPKGVPVATMSIGKSGACNAALFAIHILALKYPEYKDRLKRYREQIRKEVLNE